MNSLPVLRVMSRSAPGKEQNVEVNLEPGAWGCITSDLRSLGSLTDWKNVIVVSGQVVKTKVLRFDRRQSNKNQYIWEGVCTPKRHPLLTQGQRRKEIMK